MAIEVELKARLSQPARIESRAAELGTFQRATFKEDIYFKRRGEGASVPDDRFRLRREGEQAVVNFKHPVETGGLEVNEEVEFTVDDPHAFFQFADRFGFEPFVVKRKQARLFRIGRAQVELNEVERLGHFIEIEILCDRGGEVAAARIEIARLLNDLGLDAADLEPQLYIELLQKVRPVRYKFIDDRSLSWPFEESLLST
ncbi:MAG: class IV adenylate cyclase [Chloroflexota bacterium]